MGACGHPDIPLASPDGVCGQWLVSGSYYSRSGTDFHSGKSSEPDDGDIDQAGSGGNRTVHSTLGDPVGRGRVPGFVFWFNSSEKVILWGRRSALGDSSASPGPGSWCLSGELCHTLAGMAP